VSDAVRRPCSDFMDMLRRLIYYRIIIIIITVHSDACVCCSIQRAEQGLCAADRLHGSTDHPGQL